MKKPHPKSKFMIHEKGRNKFTVSTKQYIFWLIPIWVEITILEAENAPEQVAEFKTFEEAEEFVNSIYQIIL